MKYLHIFKKKELHIFNKKFITLLSSLYLQAQDWEPFVENLNDETNTPFSSEVSICLYI